MDLKSDRWGQHEDVLLMYCRAARSSSIRILCSQDLDEEIGILSHEALHVTTCPRRIAGILSLVLLSFVLQISASRYSADANFFRCVCAAGGGRENTEKEFLIRDICGKTKKQR